MIKLYNFDELRPEEILNRDIRAEKNVEDVVDGIIADVRARGDDALKDYALKFDGAKIDALQVTQEEIDEAFANMDPYFLKTLREAAANIESFHRQQVHKNFVVNDKPGIVLGQKYTPIEKAGVYVPGGTAAYPSTVLMDVIPAKVAGVSEIVMTTPAGKDGRVNPVILAAAATAGVTKIFKTGGAQAVAALAYGTQSIPAVDKIVGPGNIYVATAKRKVFGKVGIDMSWPRPCRRSWRCRSLSCPVPPSPAPAWTTTARSSSAPTCTRPLKPATSLHRNIWKCAWRTPSAC